MIRTESHSESNDDDVVLKHVIVFHGRLDVPCGPDVGL